MGKKAATGKKRKRAEKRKQASDTRRAFLGVAVSFLEEVHRRCEFHASRLDPRGKRDYEGRNGTILRGLDACQINAQRALDQEPGADGWRERAAEERRG